MRRLWVQLSIAFGVVIFVSATLLFVITITFYESQRQAIAAEVRSQLLPPTPTARPPGPVPIPRPEDALVILVMVGTSVGVIVGVLMSRRLAAPLSHLAATVRQMGTRNFSLRVQPSGTDEMREVATAFNEMAARLQESETLRSNLVADVAHELRTPLAVMEGSLRALIDDVYPLSKAEVLTLYDQTRHLSRMVSDLHELSLAEAHELAFERGPLDLVALLHSIAEIFRPIAEAEGIRFVADFPLHGLWVLGDAGRLRQVLQNLLVNALRHTPPGGQISLRASSHTGQAHLEVKDTGTGIPAEHVPHVFERFYRTDRARDRASGGAGLGLAIVKAIVEAHGGRVSVTSRIDPPTGTCFTIRLNCVATPSATSG
jgi:signal transduction histidine kinase